MQCNYDESAASSSSADEHEETGPSSPSKGDLGSNQYADDESDGESAENSDTGDTGIRIFESGEDTMCVIPWSHILALGEREPRVERPRAISFDCSVCEDLKSETSSTRYTAWGKRSIAELQEGTANGCRYCELLVKGIKAYVPEEELRDEDKLSARFARTLPQGKGRPAPNKYGISIFKQADEHGSWAGHAVPLGDIPSGDTESQEAIDTARSWLERCVRDHPNCGGGDDVPAPTRLIELLGSDESRMARLVEIGGEPCRYAALSHCWGPVETIKTTSDTLEARKMGIAWEELCVTFQDAIRVTGKLGLRYLWIDSLCILQDSVDDWQQEASRMATIYECAHITIAATRSSSHSIGCFSKLSSEFAVHQVSVGNRADGTELSLNFRLIMPHCPYIIQSPEQAEEFPLLNRGWVYQERLLSRRVLHFFNNELAWECNTTSSCECGNPEGNFSDGMRPPFNILAMDVGENPKSVHSQDLREGKSEQSLSLRWHGIIREYTGLKLSFAKDALPALAGLARQMHRYREGDKYLAGLWAKTLFYDLLWSAEDDRAPRPEVEYRGPSWSWLTTTSPVNYDRAHVFAILRFFPKPLAGGSTLAGPDPYGEVERPTYLHLEGLLIGGVLRYTWQENAEQELEGGGKETVQLSQQRKPDYEIVVGGVAVGPFDADYGLRLQRNADYVPDGFKVQVLLMAESDNNFFYLVLISVVLYVPGDNGPPSKPVHERIGLLTIAKSNGMPIHEMNGVEIWTENIIIR